MYTTTTHLIDAIRQRDEAAWNRFVTLYSPLLYYWCRKSRLDQHAANDVSQMVLLKVLRSVDGYQRKPHEGSFRGWLWSVCRTAILDHLRSDGRHAAAEGGTVAHHANQQIPDPHTELDATISLTLGQTDLVRRAFELIKNEFKHEWLRAFELVVIEGKNATEAGAELGMSSAAVRQAKYQVLRRLRDELGED